MKQVLLTPLLLALFALPASPSITDITDGADPVGLALAITDLPGTAGTEVVLSITDGADPIPELSSFSVVSILADPDAIPVQFATVEHKGTSIVVHVLLDDKAVEGRLLVVLGFEETGPVGILIDLASITDGADPV